MEKWNPYTRDYEPYAVPEDWYTPLVADLYEVVNCAHCGKELTYGACYTSRQIHNQYGLGYPVCEKCYSQEWNEELEADKND